MEHDARTVPDRIREVQQRYGIKQLLFVGDRGMITQANYEKVTDWERQWTISAVTSGWLIWGIWVRCGPSSS